MSIVEAPLSLTVIVLTYNEELHLERCLASVAPIAARVVVVDSFSSDGTEVTARQAGADFVQRRFVNQAEQFEWALANCAIATDWVMRLDADEYLLPELVTEVRRKLPAMADGIGSVQLKRRVVFRGTWIRWGGYYPTVLLRIFRPGAVRVEQLWMDEHIAPLEGGTVRFDHDFVDENLRDITHWTDKHNRYATRKMADYMMRAGHADGEKADSVETGRPIRDFLQYSIYRRTPLYLRSLALFTYRYFVRLGFVNGVNGFLWIFFQSLWYSMLIDAKIAEARAVERREGREGLVRWLRDEQGIALPERP